MSRELKVRQQNPFSLFQEMDRFFDDLSRNFFSDWYWPFGRRRPSLSLIRRDDEPLFRTPLTNITTDENSFNITAELPGLNKGDIEITIKNDNLEIKGEIKEEKKEEKEGELIRREVHSRKYYRSFSLPDNVDKDKIDAQLDNGILKLKIPKVIPKEPEKKTIEIK